MSEDLVRKQLHRQAVLQQRLVLPPGRTITKEEGRSLAKQQQEAVQVEEDHSDHPITATPSTVVLEADVSKKIVALRQSHNKSGNLKAALEAFREDRKLSGVINHASVQAAAQKVYAKTNADYSQLRNDRTKRAVEGVKPKSKKHAKTQSKK